LAEGGDNVRLGVTRGSKLEADKTAGRGWGRGDGESDHEGAKRDRVNKKELWSEGGKPRSRGRNAKEDVVIVGVGKNADFHKRAMV